MLFKKIFSFAKIYFLMVSISQAGIKTARRNINNFRYANDTTLMAESEEKLKSILMRMKDKSETGGLKVTNQKTRIMASGPINHGK